MMFVGGFGYLRLSPAWREQNALFHGEDVIMMR